MSLLFGFFFLLWSTTFGISTAFAADATLYVSPITGTYASGETVSLSVIAASGGQSVKVIEGKLEYNPKELEVVGVSTDESVLSSWMTFPKPANDIGEMSFGGWLATSTVLDRGILFRFSVRPLRSGETQVRFASGAAILSADGTGGNILTSLRGSNYKIIPRDETASESTPVATENSAGRESGEVLGVATDTKPVLSSPTHPDQGAWYALATSTLTWEMPGAVTGVRLARSYKPKGSGVVYYPAPKDQKVISGIEDGVWYMHLTRMFADGGSDNTSYRLNVDTTPPASVFLSERSRTDTADPLVIYDVTATDTLSGIDHYEFVIDGGAKLSWTDDGTHAFRLPTQAVGKHDISMTAFDRAGNYASARSEFSVEYMPAPTISPANDDLSEGDPLKLLVTGVPNATLSISIARGDTPVTEKFTLDNGGRGVFAGALALAPGAYQVWATAGDTRGRVSKESERVAITVPASLMGIIGRNPMIPVVIGGAILFTVFGWWFLRRRSRAHDLIDESEQPEAYDDEQFEMQPKDVYARAYATHQSEGATVILGTRKVKAHIPATRL